jgi:glycosyltransferase involved in cell wall biosynthesis
MTADVTVGLPVYNGSRTLRRTLDALLAQTHTSFELVVSDNASTDDTRDILAQYAARDRRLRVIHQERNLGAIANLHAVLEAATTTMFTWFGADDLCAPTFLERTRAALLACPTAIIATADVCLIDERDVPKRTHEQPHTVGLDAAQRMHRHFATYGWYASYGVARREQLLAFGPFERRFGPDVIRTAQWMLTGDVVRVPEVLFLFRERTGGKDAATYADLLDPGGKPAVSQPHSEMLGGVGAAIRRSALDAATAREASAAAARAIAFENALFLGQVLREQAVSFDDMDDHGRLSLIRRLLASEDSAR